MIFQVSLAILDQLKDSLVASKDDGEAMTLLSSYLEHVTNRDSTMPRMPAKVGRDQPAGEIKVPTTLISCLVVKE